MTTLTPTEITNLKEALDPSTKTKDQTSSPTVSATEKTPVSPNVAENPEAKETAPSNTPINASGNASLSATAIKKGNETLSKACGSDLYVGKAIAQAGAFAGQLMRKLREAIKAALKALGFNPGASGLMSQLKKFAQWLKDQSKWIKEITKYISQFIAYVNAIKEIITFLMSLPSLLLQYFKECISLLGKQLMSSFTDALGGFSGNSSPDFEKLTKDVKEIQSNVSELTSSVSTLASTATTAIGSLSTMEQTSLLDTKMQDEATKTVYAAAGFNDTKEYYSKA